MNQTVKSTGIPASAGSRHWIADLSLLATTIIWGINIVVFKYSIGVVDPVVFNAARLVFSALALGVCVAIERRWRRRPLLPDMASARKVPWFRVAVFAVLTGILYIVLFVLGIARTTAGSTALLLASMPMWTAVLSRIFLAENLRRITWIGLATTFAGTAIVTLSGGKVDLGPEYLAGNLIMLSAAFCWAVATVMSSSIFRSITPLELAFITSLTTTPLHVIWSWQSLSDSWDELTRPAMLAAIVFSGALSTGVAYALWNTGVKILGGAHASVYQNIVTLIAVSGGWVLLGEPVLIGQVIGGLVMIAGVLVIRRGRRPAVPVGPAFAKPALK